jgi:hypothetical protein
VNRLIKIAWSVCSLLCAPVFSRAEEAPPFTLTVTPSYSGDQRQGIYMGNDNKRSFDVVLTNTSKVPQPVWETWNSWGYQTVSFQITTTKGGVCTVRVKPHVFTRNFPSVFEIAPGESQVYPIVLDEKWETDPKLEKLNERIITLKAVYQVSKDPQAAEDHVWCGKVESKAYQFILESK